MLLQCSFQHIYATTVQDKDSKTHFRMGTLSREYCPTRRCHPVIKLWRRGWRREGRGRGGRGERRSSECQTRCPTPRTGDQSRYPSTTSCSRAWRRCRGRSRALRAAQNSMRHARTRRGRLAASQSRPHLFRRRTGTGRLLGEDEESDASDVFRDDADDALAVSASEDSGGDSDDSRAPTRRGRGRKRRRAGDGEEGGASTRKAATAAQARRKYIDKVVERVVAESDSLSSIPSPSDVDIGGIPDLRAVQDDETDVDSDSSADSARIRDLAPRQGKLFRDKLANEVYADHVERWRRSSRNARV